MRMEGGATPNALLGLLSLGSMSGYDIRQLISQSIGHFWSESYGQIYPGLKLFFGGQVSPSVSRAHVQTYLESHEKELQVYGAIAKKLRKEEADDPQLPFWLMTLNMGRHHSAAIVKWCKETLAEL